MNVSSAAGAVINTNFSHAQDIYFLWCCLISSALEWYWRNDDRFAPLNSECTSRHIRVLFYFFHQHAVGFLFSRVILFGGIFRGDHGWIADDS